MSSYDGDPIEEELQLLRQLRAAKNGIITNQTATLAIANRLVKKGWAWNEVLDVKTKTIQLWRSI